MSNFSQHIVLYSKGHYGKSDKGIIEDVRKLLSEYTNVETDHFSKDSILEEIVHAYIDYDSEFTSYQKDEWMREIIGIRWSPPYNRTPEQVMIGALSILRGSVIENVEKLNISL